MEEEKIAERDAQRAEEHAREEHRKQILIQNEERMQNQIAEWTAIQGEKGERMHMAVERKGV